MATSQLEAVLSELAGPIGSATREESGFRPWLFQDGSLIRTPQTGKSVAKEVLTNKLNHINFTDGAVLVHLRHVRYAVDALAKAHPEPCLGDKVTCRWSNGDLSGAEPGDYELLHLVIDDGQSMTLVPAALEAMDAECFTTQLPETSYIVTQRKIRRHACKGVDAELIQHGFQANGQLLDFSPAGFRIRVSPGPTCSFHWFNSAESVSILLRRNEQVLFSGPCRCIRERGGLHFKEIVLEPVAQETDCFEKKSNRNVRQQLTPTPIVSFNHPFFNKRVQLHVHDISTSGFSLCENEEEGVLIPGMIIPELTINYAGAVRMQCKAQVIRRCQEEGKGIRCGFSILDMDIDNYSRLTHILSNALDPHAHISTDVDIDSLWEFFFDTGFVYPMKYRLIQSYKEDFKKTYRKLYEESPEIARHFTYQRDGRIYGHISMVRAYGKAWMIHHHAGKCLDNKRPGVIVLKQIMRYLNDMRRLPSANMDYVMSYFRPENKFPNRVFGGFAKALDNPRGCSMDLFCYLPYTSLSLGVQLPTGWSLNECSASDVRALDHFYSQHSGGRLLKALGLLQKKDSCEESLEEVYKRAGLFRKWRAYALAHKGELNAVLVVNQSNLGINLSELLNNILVIVTNPQGLVWNVLSSAISQLTGSHDMKRVPVLFYPIEYVKDKDVPYEKQYYLWALDVQYGDEYMAYMERRFRMS